MWCSNCPCFDTCEDPAKLGGGCDIDGAYDFGVDPVEDLEVECDFTADHEAGLEPEIVSEGRPQAVRTAHRIARAKRRSNTASIAAALGTVEKRGSGETAFGTPHAGRETREAQRRTV